MTFHSSPEGTAFATAARKRPQTAHNAQNDPTAHLSGLPLAEALIRAGVARDIAFRTAGMADPIPFEPNRPISEKEEQRRIRRDVINSGGEVWSTSSARRSKIAIGFPDDWIALPSIGLFWEAKRAGEARTPEQLRFAEQCERNGTPYGWGTHRDFLAWCQARGVTIQPVGE